jgi:hypothetical protein
VPFFVDYYQELIDCLCTRAEAEAGMNIDNVVLNSYACRKNLVSNDSVAYNFDDNR